MEPRLESGRQGQQLLPVHPGRPRLPDRQRPARREVGCTYAIRGFDFDYLGVLWLRDLLWRDGRWVVNVEHIHESGLSRATSRAGNESSSDGPAHQFLTQKLQEAYRILFTRAIKGVAVYVADSETREHLMEALGDSREAF